jgi:hypothetical protein
MGERQQASTAEIPQYYKKSLMDIAYGEVSREKPKSEGAV